MKCIECGHELKDGAIFCIRCGAMQVSMDGKPIESKEEWPEVEAQTGASGFRSSTEGALHSAQSKNPRSFKPAPKHNGGRIAAVIVVIVALIALIAFAVTQCVAPAISGADDSSASSQLSVSTSASSSSASSEASSSSASASASASAAASDASSSASAAAPAAEQNADQQGAPQQEVPQVVPEPAPAPAPEPAPAPAPAPANDYYVLPDSSSYYYSYDELNSMSTYDLYIARNEIYARHGRMFNRSDLQDYFNSQAWYEPIYTAAQFDSMGNQLSDVELQNAKLMKQVEADKGSAYL